MPSITGGGSTHSVRGRNAIVKENIDIYDAGKFVPVLN
jgi:hypothetical protein